MNISKPVFLVSQVEEQSSLVHRWYLQVIILVSLVTADKTVGVSDTFSHLASSMLPEKKHMVLNAKIFLADWKETMKDCVLSPKRTLLGDLPMDSIV